ncbi:hypothetical protein [Lysinibacillus sp. NPDC096212]|uniref:hypothetical protein n=1 Tax=Lysinibacillus sp. NPDC096212 TaxID=3364135 RepID=UPI0038023822
MWFKKCYKVIAVCLTLSLLCLNVPINQVYAIENESVIQSEEEIADIEKALELIFENGIVTDSEGETLGYNKELFEQELKDSPIYEDIIQGMEANNLFADQENENNIRIAPRLAACGWHLMKNSPEYTSASNKCLSAGIKAAYGPVTVLSTLANLLADKEFKLAAGHLVKAGIRGNILGIVVTLSGIHLDCVKKMEKKFPGKSNCI